jgi:hypothetical protein
MVDKWKTNFMSLAILFHLLCAQHVSDINISIFRSLRLCWWITTSVVLFSVRCVLDLCCGSYLVVLFLHQVGLTNHFVINNICKIFYHIQFEKRLHISHLWPILMITIQVVWWILLHPSWQVPDLIVYNSPCSMMSFPWLISVPCSYDIALHWSTTFISYHFEYLFKITRYFDII